MPINSRAVIHAKSNARPVDDETPTLGEGESTITAELGESYQLAVHETMRHAKSPLTIRGFRNRITRIAQYWKEECPRYFAIGVRKITDAERADPQMFFHPKRDKYDLVYAGLSIDFVLKFLVAKEKKDKDGQYRTFNDMRKYRDAINFGAGVRSEYPSTNFSLVLDKYLASYQKKTASAKKEGKVDTQEADPITFELYCMINQWAFEEGNILVLFWTLTQWNCIARCGSIDPLGFRNFKIVSDAHSVTYDSTKMDKEGKKCFAKHIYANHENWFMCQWTGMGLYCMVYADELGMTDKLFADMSNCEGTASKKYQEQLQAIVNRDEERLSIVLLHCRPSHFNPYGIRKGGATHATSGTTHAPNLTSVAHRGDWSMGCVFDIYWRFLPQGDHYLGQVLSGKDPNKPSFKTLPPHWKLTNPMTHPEIKEAMEANFGPILKAHGGEEYDPTGLLLRCLACVVHHSDALLAILDSGSNLDHPLFTVPLFGAQSNLEKLKDLVTTDPTPGVMTAATGIPPHVETACQLQEIRDALSSLVTQTREFAEEQRRRDERLQVELVKVVRETVEENDIRAGNVTDSRIAALLQQQRKEITDDFTRGLNQVLAKIPGAQTPQQVNPQIQQPNGNGELSTAKKNKLFFHGGGFWGVPAHFQFPQPIKTPKALRLWLTGSRASPTEVVRPFRLLRSKRGQANLLPPPLRDTFNVSWKQFFNFLEKAGLLDGLPSDTAAFTNQQIEQCIEKMWTILQERASYVFLARATSSTKTPAKAISLSTWAKLVLKSKIQDLGTEQDKAYLDGEPQRRQSAQRPNRGPTATPLYLQRQQKRNRTNGNPRILTGLSAAQEQIARDQEEDRMEGRAAATGSFINRDVETLPSHAAWLRENIGTKNNPKPCPIVDGREQPIAAKCAVAICNMPTCPLGGRMSHYCDRRECGLPVHQPCCQDARLWFEDDKVRNFCSEFCMVAFRNLDDHRE